MNNNIFTNNLVENSTYNQLLYNSIKLLDEIELLYKENNNTGYNYVNSKYITK